VSRSTDALVAGAFLPWLGWWGTAAALAVRAAAPAGATPPPAELTLDVVIPAHNESAVIGDLLDALHRQQGPARLGRVLVVADHCSDDTAAVARSHGVEVLERSGGGAGKPPSLREGVAQLGAHADRGDAVVLLDADCTCNDGFLSALSARLAAGATVVQAAYTIADDGDTAVRSSLRRAFALRNVVRAEGGARFGLPTLLVGSGIVLTWDVVPLLSWADPRLSGTGDSRPVGDDVLMTVELIAQGHPAAFAGDASVVASAPSHEGDLGAQRLRWETGQIFMWKLAARNLPGLVARRDVKALVALADWVNPPLVPTVAAFTAVGAAATVLVAAGAASPVVLVVPAVAAGCLATYLGVGVSILEGPKAAVDLFVGAPRFVGWKAGLYLRHREARRTSTVVRSQP
jgi:cellulose synthase/poly-beta-1,6-N-acetylglucosamine synthase-like glycosyltransferase